MTAVSRGIDRIEVTFDEPNLVANAGLLLVATLVARLHLERLINTTVDLSGRIGGAVPGRKVLTLVHAMVAGGSHIDHADVIGVHLGKPGGFAGEHSPSSGLSINGIRLAACVPGLAIRAVFGTISLPDAI